MLSQLYIKNFAVIKELTVDLKDGFNVFTGETGAGKTMLINAITGILGGRLSKDLVRTGEDKSTIIAKFDMLSNENIQYCIDLGYECDGEILVSRELSAEGKSNCKVNGKPATLNIIKNITGNLIAIHGQKDGNIFSDNENEVNFIDKYGDYNDLLSEYKSNFSDYQEITRKIKALITDEAQKEQKIDILSYQINEIDEAEISIGEEDELLAKRKKIRNSEKIRETLGETAEILNDNENSAIEQMENIAANLSELSNYLSDYDEISQKCNDMVYELQEIYNSIRNDLDEFDEDDNDINYIERRIDLIHKLERKYGGDEETILDFYEKAKQELKQINTSEENYNKYKDEQIKIKNKLTKLAQKLTDKRKQNSEIFIKKVQSELAFLDMPNVKLCVEFEIQDFQNDGQDKVEILISANPGEPPKPISKIASGGEISRIMLAIKNVMADKDNIPSLIFDEIDTGVSGKAAQKIGQKLREVSKNHQIICITHLAQVASFGNTHFYIHKDIKDEHTFTSVDELNNTERINELARIVVGDKITTIALENAKEMLLQNNK